MKLRARNALLLLLTTTLMVVSVGCPNSTAITSGIGTAQLVINMTNLNRFEVGAFNIRRILIQPIDANAQQSIGTARDIILTRSSVFVDATLPNVDPGFLTPVTLSAGTYEIVEMEFSGIFFVDTVGFVPDPMSCEGSQQFFSSLPNIMVTSFATPQRFTISDTQDTQVTLTFDMTQYITTLTNAFTCTPGCNGFCISNFDPVQFAGDTLDYLTIN